MSTAPYLLVGEAPNAATSARPRAWLLPDRSGIQHAANRLLAATGYELRTYLRLFQRTNLLDFAPPRSKHGGYEFPLEAARPRAGALVSLACLQDQAILILGKRAASAFTWSDRVDYFEWSKVFSPAHSCLACVVPHPSGTNRWWNEVENRIAARSFFDGLVAP